jgi:drug/metabolite transporter (DMT)-like permease
MLLWVVPALWSSNYLIARASEGVIGPHLLALGRWVLAIALLLPFTWAMLARAQGREAVRREWPQMLALGALGMWVCGAFVYQGAITTSAINIGLIYAASPVGIALAGRWLLKEKATLTQRLGMAFALLGVLVVISRGDPASLLAVQLVPGDLWIAVAATGWAAYTVLLQRWPTTLNARQRLACIVAGGLLVLLPFTALEVYLLPTPPWSWKALMLIALAALLPGFLSYQAYSFMLNVLGATRTAVMLYLAPLYGAFNAWWILGEAPAWFHAAGAALILPSIYLATRGSVSRPT